MRSLLVCSILSLGLSWAQHSIAAPASRHPSPIAPAAPAICETSLDDFLHHVAAGSKHVGVSPRLTPAQYAFVQDEIKKHSKDHKVAPGDGAMVIDTDGQFLMAATLGANVCMYIPIPVELVAAIVAVEDPPKVATPPAPKADSESPWL